MTGQLMRFTEGENVAFPGCAREGNLLATLLYFPEDYARHFGGDYEDYLIERHFFLRDVYGSGEPVRVVTVPFLREEFLKSGLPDTPEGHVTWALRAAKNPEKLLKLREKAGALPGPQLEEAFACRVVFAAFTLPVRGAAELAYLRRNLRAKFVRQAAKRLGEACLSGLPPFRALSRRRASGVGLAVGDAPVSAEAAGDLAFVLEDERGVEAPGFASMNGVLRVDGEDTPVWPEEFGPDEELVFTVFLPLVFGGDITTATLAAFRVAEGRLNKEKRTVLEQELKGVFLGFLPGDYPYYRAALSTLTLVPSWKIPEFLEELQARTARLTARFYGPPGLSVVGNGYLRRVK
ncbi:hypothetical protein Adeg_0718 [Ammonifex degensii KC4]|uniref:Uncharacterized protein n=1 Tax=Ammonifex degensii (strain DSM 10501 / KC4) TaxID=429009 RepID=C9RC88_AMMDK|nr:hypothetical protein [Ammonifex degensii]ACX51865.1 hypothetical protein Adeg_0718 [Ammonifex degensii KC4]